MSDIAYIYQAALHCERCGEAICERIRGTPKYAELFGDGRADPDDDNTFDSDDFPKSACDAGGESDTPQHCDSCGEPLGNALTSDGVEYVLDSIKEEIEKAVENGRAIAWDTIGTVRPGDYYAGSPRIEVCRDWAKDLLNYNLEKDETAIVNLFLELSTPITVIN